MLAVLMAIMAGPEMLAGSWTVDLSPAGDGSYTQPMRLELKPDGTVAGQFYQSDILEGRWAEKGGRLCVSFETSDGQGDYQTAACLAGDRVEGQTWAEHRAFVMPWTATRGD